MTEKLTAASVLKLKALAKKLRADTRGFVLPYVMVMLVVIVGVSVLAIDGARVMSLQTQLQRSADALALAGAAALDQGSASITRATNAINNTVSNSTLAGMGNQTVAVLSIRFPASLPASGATAVAAGNVTTDALLAKFVYVEVTVQPVSLVNILPASFFGGMNTKTAGAVAVAGRGAEVVCGTCTGVAGYNAAAMNAIVYGRGSGACNDVTSVYNAGMCDFFSRVTPANVRVVYEQTGLGYSGRPYPIPAITVSLQNLPFRLYFLGGLMGFGNIQIPASATMTGEDLCSGPRASNQSCPA